MIKTKFAISGSLLAVLLMFVSGCASTVKVYDGPRLPANKLSTLQPDFTAKSHLSEINIRRINGKRVSDAINPEYKVLPGLHTLNVELHKPGGSRSAVAASHAINNVSFTAQPGHDYRVLGEIKDGIGIVWVEDKASGQKVSR